MLCAERLVVWLRNDVGFRSPQLINNIKMEKTYRLEFNEKQQNFHLDNYTHEPNTFGWFTITDHCSDFEFKVFEAYVNRNHNNNVL
jgi:hypothetical protein